VKGGDWGHNKNFGPWFSGKVRTVPEGRGTHTRNSVINVAALGRFQLLCLEGGENKSNRRERGEQGHSWYIASSLTLGEKSVKSEIYPTTSQSGPEKEGKGDRHAGWPGGAVCRR